MPPSGTQKVPVIPSPKTPQTPVISGQVIPKPVQNGAVQQSKSIQPLVVKPIEKVGSPVIPQKLDIKLVPKVPTNNVVNKPTGVGNPVVSQSAVVAKPSAASPVLAPNSNPATAPKSENASRYYHYPTAPTPNTAR